MNNLLELFKNSPELKRLNELKEYFSKNKDLDNKMKELKRIQKLIVRAKVNSDLEGVKKLSNEYEKIKDEIIELPFVEEYFELLDILHNDLEKVSLEIEYSINEDFNL